MKNGLIILVFSLLNLSVLSNISEEQFSQKFYEANHLMEEKLWNRASNIWELLVAQDQFNGNINYKLGYCLLQTANRKLEALPYLEVAVGGGISKSYDPFDAAEKKAPIESKYYLARAYHLDYQLDKAISEYDELMSKVSNKHRLSDDSKRQIEMCEEAKKQLLEPKKFIIENVGSVINNEYNDYSPVVNVDESTMFFTSRRLRVDSTNVNITDDDTGEVKEDIYAVYKQKDGTWSPPELLNINTDRHAASISVSPDAQTLYIYYDETGGGDIYKSELVGESWTTPELMASDINTDSWETHLTVATDEQSLYFTSDREGGFGGRDIYRCVKMPDGSWSKGLNLGPTLNTEYEEDAVFISIDGKTLYFSSSGHNSMGDFDIFYSRKGDDGEWTEPENIGYPLNTTDADVFFYPVDGRTAYYSSRREEGYGLKDIYKITMPNSDLEQDLTVLKGYVYPATGDKLPGNCLVVVTNKASGEVKEYNVRQRDGAYIAILPPCQAYEIEYFVDDALVEEEFINVPCESGYNSFNKEVFLQPVQLENEDDENAMSESGSGNYTGEDGSSCAEEIARLQAQIDALTKKLSGEALTSSTEFDKEKATAKYERYFLYDSDASDQENKFNEFMENLGKIIELNDEVTLFIEASASEVPSSRFANNQKLASSRASKAKKEVLQAAKKRGINTNKIKFKDPFAHVQGPQYNNDAQKNRATYELYQYIKISAE